MTEEEWFASDDARDMLGRSTLPNPSDRKLRLFAVACCRCCRQLMRNASHRDDVDLAERFADGQATETELAAAHRRVNDLACAHYADTKEREIRRWAEMVAVANAVRLPADAGDAVWNLNRAAQRGIALNMVALLRDIVGNPFRPVVFSPEWRTSTAVAIARGMYESRDFSPMPILADALQDAGCYNDDVLNHCRDPQQVHVRGCWVVDHVLGKT